MNKNLNKVLIATGGTGGHIFPAYSLAKHLVEKKINVEIVSDERGIRYLKRANNIKISKINTSSFYNKNFLQKFISLIIIALSVVKSFVYLIGNKPNLVFGMGGYSSFPICIVAKLLNIPFIIYENNLHLGKANKFLLPFTIKLFVARKELTGVPAKYENKICQTGNIIRKEIPPPPAHRRNHRAGTAGPAHHRDRRQKRAGAAGKKVPAPPAKKCRRRRHR